MNKLNLPALLEKTREIKLEWGDEYSGSDVDDCTPDTLITLCEALIEAREALEKIQTNHCGHPNDLKQHRVETARSVLININAKIDFGSEGE